MTLSYQPPGNGHSKLRAYIEVQLPWPLPNIAIVARGGIFDCLMKKQQQQHNANGSGSASGAGIVVAFGSEKESRGEGGGGGGRRRRRGRRGRNNGANDGSDDDDTATPPATTRVPLLDLPAATKTATTTKRMATMTAIKKLRFWVGEERTETAPVVPG